MSTIKEQQKIAEEDVIEQAQISRKLKKASGKDDIELLLKEAAADKTNKIADKKKGQKVSWVPSRRIPKVEAPEGFVAAWKHNTPENVRRLQYEGWEIANRIEHNMDVDMGNYYKKLNDSPTNDKESIIEHNELICMLLPEEMAESRKAYHKNEIEQMTRTVLRPEQDPKKAALSKFGSIKTNIELN